MSRKLVWIALAAAAIAWVAWWVSRDGQEVEPRPRIDLPASEAPGSSPFVDPTVDSLAATPELPTQARSSAVTSAPALARGRIVDQRRFPAPGANVRIVRADGSSFETKSDPRGEFAIAIPERPRNGEIVQLLAWRDSDAAFVRRFLSGVDSDSSPFFRPSRTDVEFGTVALTPAHALRVEVTSGAKPVAGARVVVREITQRSLLWSGITDGSAHALTPPLPRGGYDVSASDAAFAGLQRAFLPEENDIRIALTPKFVAEVTVVDKQTGLPIPGARVDLTERSFLPASVDGNRDDRMGPMGEGTMSSVLEPRTALTDASGIARFPGLHAPSKHSAIASATGYGNRDGRRSGREVSDSKPCIRIELEATHFRTVTFPIAPGEVTLASGTKIALRSAQVAFLEDVPLSLEGVVRVNEVVVENLGGSAGLLGTAEDGSMAIFRVDDESEIGGEVSFLKPRAIEVIVRDELGAPVQGVMTEALDPGNIPLGARVRTDAGGRAVLRGLYGSEADIVLYREPPAIPGRIVAGNVDLTSGDGKLECVLSSANREARVTLQVLFDGAPRLPDSFSVRTEEGCRVLEERPDRSELEIALVRPSSGGDAHLTLLARGAVAATTSVHLNGDEAPARATIEVARGATIVAHVLQDEGQEANVSVHGWQAGDRRWTGQVGRISEVTRPNGPNGSFCFGPLGPGRYRLHDASSTLVSEEFEIRAGSGEVHVDLDLRGVEWVSGRVEGPEGQDLASAVILIPERGAFLHIEEPAQQTVDSDGAFRLPVRRGQPTRLEVWHPWLAPADPGGSIVVEGAREGIVFRLVQGDEVVLKVPQLCPVSRTRVAVFAGPVRGTPIADLRAPWVSGSLRFHGVPRGKFTLWIDPGDAFAPLVLSDVEVLEGTTDLGTAEFPLGSALTLRRKDVGGPFPPRVSLRAVREQPLSLQRWMESDSATLRLGGLEAGTYRVTWGTLPENAASNERTITVDGTNDVELESN